VEDSRTLVKQTVMKADVQRREWFLQERTGRHNLMLSPPLSPSLQLTHHSDQPVKHCPHGGIMSAVIKWRHGVVLEAAVPLLKLVESRGIEGPHGLRHRWTEQTITCCYDDFAHSPW